MNKTDKEPCLLEFISQSPLKNVIEMTGNGKPRWSAKSWNLVNIRALILVVCCITLFIRMHIGFYSMKDQVEWKEFRPPTSQVWPMFSRQNFFFF